MGTRDGNLVRTRGRLAGVLETTVAMATTILVTVFFVLLVAFPEVGLANTTLDGANVDLCTD